LIDYKVEVEWPNKEVFEKSPEIFKEEKRAVLYEAGLVLEKEVIARTPVGVTGLLRKTIAAQLIGDRVEVGTPLEYAEPVEYGARPHWAPLEALELWGLRKLGDVEAGRKVWYSIAQKGTRPALMFTRGLAASYVKIENILKSVGERIAARFK